MQRSPRLNEINPYKQEVKRFLSVDKLPVFSHIVDVLERRFPNFNPKLLVATASILVNLQGLIADKKLTDQIITIAVEEAYHVISTYPIDSLSACFKLKYARTANQYYSKAATRVSLLQIVENRNL